MDRKTGRDETGYFAQDCVCTAGAARGEAIDRLGKFETLWQDIEAEQLTLSAEMEKLRAAGKQNTVKFRELMVKKLNNANMLAVFQARGL